MRKFYQRYRGIKAFFYRILEDPDSNAYVNLVMMAIIIASIMVMILEAEPKNEISAETGELLGNLDLSFSLIFLVEYVLRWWVCSNFTEDFKQAIKDYRRGHLRHSRVRVTFFGIRAAFMGKIRWMIKPMSIIDLLAILPAFRFFRLFRVVQVVRILKLFRYSRRLSFFTSIAKERSYELMSLFIMGIVIWGMVAVAFYVAERGVNPKITTIWEAIYWSIITITTVGYGDITPDTSLGRVIAVFGTLIGMWIAVFMTSIIVSALTERIMHLREHRMERQIDRLKDHLIVCGLDTLGRAVCRALVDERRDFVVIDHNQERVDTAQEEGWIAICGDVTEENTWDMVGLSRAAGVISAIVDESTNVYIILIVKELQPNCFTVACGGTRLAKKRLKRVGADRVITPFHIGGRQLAQTALRPTAIQLFDLALQRSHMELEMEELFIPTDSRFDSIRLQDSEIRREFDVIIVGIVPADGGTIQFNPGANALLKNRDTLICLGHRLDLKRLREALEDRKVIRRSGKKA
ncbi:NAD-binding protein [Magnetococcales bacterium HHB-1]